MFKKIGIILALTIVYNATAYASSYYLKDQQRACNKKEPHLNLKNYLLQNIRKGEVKLNDKDHPDTQYCRGFNLTADQVEDFFENACIHGEVGFIHTVAGSPCYVEGEMVLADGKKMTWIIHASAYGYVNYGKSDEIKLWCPQCDAPF